MAAVSKITAFILSFISRSFPSLSPQDVKSSEGEGDLAALCKNLVNAAGPTAVAQLYGKEIRSQVDEWLSFAGAAQADRDPVSVSARLKTLDSYLLTRAVLLGGGFSVGLADIALFLSIHDEVAALLTEERSSYPNLLRWIDYVQNKNDKSHAYEWILVVKPKFDPPVSSAQPDSKKVVSAAWGASGKEKISSETFCQQKLFTKEENGRPDPLPEKKGASQADGTKANRKEKKAKPEGVSVRKADTDDDAKKVQKEGKEPTPAQKNAFGLEILDIKVGVIKTLKKHPTAETLYVEEIDVGEGSLRQVVSGLANYLTEDEMLEGSFFPKEEIHLMVVITCSGYKTVFTAVKTMKALYILVQNRRVLVLANVKPSKLRDVMSSGLVLCTTNDEQSHCEPVIPPVEAKIGERVTAEGYEGKPEAVLNPKKKQWDKIYPDLHTDDMGVACYKGKPLTTSAGPCTSSILNGTIK